MKMPSLKRLLLLSSLVLTPLLSCAEPNPTGEAPDTASAEDILYAANTADTANTVLVLLNGRSGSALMSGSRMMMYRARGYSPDLSWNRQAAESIAEHHGLAYVTDWWMQEIGLNCAVLKLPTDKNMEDTLTALRADMDVVSAERMGVFSTLSQSEMSDPFVDLQESVNFFDLNHLHQIATGKNIKIAVIDTGVEFEHPDLNGQIIARENFVDAISPSFAEDLHGTAVAGVIAAHSGNNAGIVGVAPDAKIVALKACWPAETGAMAANCNSFTLALALHRALALEVDVINLSLSGPNDRIIELLIQEALARGILVVAANHTATDGHISFPASVSGVIGVTDNLPQQVPEQSVLVVAPSNKIITTVPVGKYNFVSGTSLGAAQISGYLALLLQQYPRASQTEIRMRLADAQRFTTSQAGL